MGFTLFIKETRIKSSTIIVKIKQSPVFIKAIMEFCLDTHVAGA